MRPKRSGRVRDAKIAVLRQALAAAEARKKRSELHDLPRGECDVVTIIKFLRDQAGCRDYGQIPAGASSELRRSADRLQALVDKHGPDI